MTQGKTHREPLLRIAKRDGIARPKAWAIRIIAVLLSLVVSGIFIFAVTKLNPFQVYEGIFDGAFGTPRRSWVTVRDAMMLLCIGVGLAPAFKMRFWNIGAEGQILSMAFVPEDRLGMGLVGSMGMADNMMLKTYRSGRGPLLDRKPPRQLAERVKEELDVLTPSINTPVRRLSGGNVQKVLVGREIAQNPSVLMTAYAVRGLDINTSYTIYNLLTAQKLKGVAVIYVGEDLDVLLELCDRILVLCGGQVSGIVDGRTTTKEEVGLLMTRFVKEAKEA